MPIGPSPNDFSILDFLGHRFRIVRSNYEHYPTDAAAITVLKSFAYFSEYTSKFDRTSPLNILEVGVFEGGGAMMLALLFPNAKIVGIDSRAKPSGVDAYLAHPDFNRRVRFNWGVSQTDRTRIDRIISEEFGNGEIDLVIDDASHQYIQSKATFEIVFPRLCRNGIYIIEDWSWAHWAGRFQESEWKDKDALTNLAFEIMMLAATSPHLVLDVRVNASTISVRRGTKPVPPEFEIGNHILMRGKTLTRI